jgi:hypothetical protein
MTKSGKPTLDFIKQKAPYLWFMASATLDQVGQSIEGEDLVWAAIELTVENHGYEVNFLETVEGLLTIDAIMNNILIGDHMTSGQENILELHVDGYHRLERRWDHLSYKEHEYVLNDTVTFYINERRVYHCDYEKEKVERFSEAIKDLFDQDPDQPLSFLDIASSIYEVFNKGSIPENAGKLQEATIELSREETEKIQKRKIKAEKKDELCDQVQRTITNKIIHKYLCYLGKEQEDKNLQENSPALKYLLSLAKYIEKHLQSWKNGLDGFKLHLRLDSTDLQQMIKKQSKDMLACERSSYLPLCLYHLYCIFKS